MTSGAFPLSRAANEFSDSLSASHAIRENEERLSLALDATLDGLWDWDIPSGRVYLSRQWAKLLGYELEAVPQRVEFFFSLLHPDDVDRIKRVLSDHMAGLTPVKQDEIRLRMKCGEYRWFLDRGKVVERDGDGAPLRMVGTITDITEKRRNECLLRGFALLANRLNKVTEIKGASRLIADLADELLGWDAAAMDLIDPQTNTCRSVLAVDLVSGRKQDVASASEGKPLSDRMAWTVEHGGHLLLRSGPDVEVENFTPFGDVDRRSASLMFVSIHDGSATIGVLTIQSYKQNAYKRADLGTLQSLADYCGGALSRILSREARDESEARLRDAQAISQTGYFHWSAQTQQVLWSDELYRIYGRTRDEFSPSFENYVASIHPEDRPAVLESLQAAMTPDGKFDHDYRVVLPDDSSRWVHARGNAVTDESGQFAGLEGTCQDITQRKRIEQALSDSELRWKFAIEGAGDGLWDWDLRTDAVFYSGRWKEMLGFEEHEIGNSLAEWESRIHPQDKERAIADTAAHLDGKTPIYINEHRVRAKDGTWKWMLDRGVVLTRDADGKPLRMIGIQSDITARKSAEGRFRRLFESNIQGVVFWHSGGKITEANDAFLRMTGYTRDDLNAGRVNWMAMTPPEYTNTQRSNHEQLAANGVCAPYEKEYFRKDGSRVPVLVGEATFEDKANEGVAFVLDLTERKSLEQQFLRAQRVESIGTLAGGIAHDLNNVLGPIMMSLDLLAMRFTDAASKELISIISASATAGAGMVNQVLSFARGVAGKRVDVQLRYLIQDIRKLADETFLKHIDVRTNLPADLWPVVADPTQIHQVLLNLSVNARDAMPHGGTLKISARNATCDAAFVSRNLDAKPGAYVVIEVEDTGVGIAPEVIDRIFDPFFTTKEVGEGSGLGLSTSLGIVKGHGGFVRVSSAPGLGTKFQVYLPASAEGTAVEQAPTAPMPRGNQELILIVDDEKAMREMTRRALEAYGYRVIVARDASDAVAAVIAQQREIAAVILDMMMPVMDGPATIEALQKIAPRLPIIATSGFLSDKNLKRATALGVKLFLPKPCPLSSVLEALKTAIAGEESPT